MSLQPGAISPIIHTQGDYRILKLISKEPAGQRDLNDPRVQENIRENLRNSADQVLTQRLLRSGAQPLESGELPGAEHRSGGRKK